MWHLHETSANMCGKIYIKLEWEIIASEEVATNNYRVFWGHYTMRPPSWSAFTSQPKHILPWVWNYEQQDDGSCHIQHRGAFFSLNHAYSNSVSPGPSSSFWHPLARSARNMLAWTSNKTSETFTLPTCESSQESLKDEMNPTLGTRKSQMPGLTIPRW
jgi:hypothetical protein